jgi:integrase
VEAVEEMKNKSSKRTLPLPEPVYMMLLEEKAKKELYKQMFKSSYKRDYDDYVCVNQLGDLIKPSYVTGHFHELLKDLGLRKIRFHDLRHTFASVLLNNDVPLINVSNFLGHSDISTTANIYAHLDKSSKRL